MGGVDSQRFSPRGWTGDGSSYSPPRKVYLHVHIYSYGRPVDLADSSEDY